MALKQVNLGSILDIKSKISLIRDFQVILDSDLAALYNVQTKDLNQAVKRNIKRFPEQFCFRLNKDEYKSLISQFVTSKGRGGRQKLPYVFTEEGVAMLSGVLKSDVAVYMSIRIMRAFVEMRKIIHENSQLFTRMDIVEKKQIETDKKFDAYKFVSSLIRLAKKKIILIDNFVDETVLTLFSKRKKGVTVTIYCNIITPQLALDFEKYNSQYPKIEIKEFKMAHDRFLIIDNKDIYHFGASIKDLGKKWFAFSKFDKQALILLDKLK